MVAYPKFSPFELPQNPYWVWLNTISRKLNDVTIIRNPTVGQQRYVDVLQEILAKRMFCFGNTIIIKIVGNIVNGKEFFFRSLSFPLYLLPDRWSIFHLLQITFILAHLYDDDDKKK